MSFLRPPGTLQNSHFCSKRHFWTFSSLKTSPRDALPGTLLGPLPGTPRTLLGPPPGTSWHLPGTPLGHLSGPSWDSSGTSPWTLLGPLPGTPRTLLAPPGPSLGHLLAPPGPSLGHLLGTPGGIYPSLLRYCRPAILVGVLRPLCAARHPRTCRHCA